MFYHTEMIYMFDYMLNILLEKAVNNYLYSSTLLRAQMF